MADAVEQGQTAPPGRHDDYGRELRRTRPDPQRTSDVAWATELLYVLLGPENWHLIRRELGRDDHHYRDWLRTTLTASFSTSNQ